MKGKLLTALVLVAGGSLALAADAPPAEGGMGGGFDPAAAFKAADKNNDGKLSMEEFAAMPTPNRGGGAGGEGMGGGGGGGGEGMGGGGAAASPADRFKAMDTNSDGSVSMEEFTAGMARRGGGGMGGGGMGGG